VPITLVTLAIILFAWGFAALTFTGLGLLANRRWGSRTPSAQLILDSFWIGWAVVIAGLQIWHLFLPVRWYAFVVFALPAFAGIVIEWPALRRLLAEARPPAMPTLFAAGAALGAAALAYRSIVSPMPYDLGFYHWQSVRWATAYPIIPGLGNLFRAYGLNSSHFLYAGLFEAGPLAGHSPTVVNGLFVLAFAMQGLRSGWRLVRGGRVQGRDVFALLLIPGAVDVAMRRELILSPDLLVWVLGAVIAIRLFEVLDDAVRGRQIAAHNVFFIAAIAAAGVTVKLSFAVVGAIALAIAAAVWIWQNRDRLAELRRGLWQIALAGLALLVPWMVRGVILTGYPAFPVPALSVPVDWRVPREEAVLYVETLRTWERQPGYPVEEVLAGWGWLQPWLESRLYNEPRISHVAPLAIGLLGVLAALAGRVMVDRAARPAALIWLVLLPPLLNLPYWFLSAPAPRHLGATLWWLMAGSVTLALCPLLRRRTRLAVIFVAVLCAALTGFAAQPFSLSELHAGMSLPAVPEPELRSYTTSSGLELWVPASGDQCWDAPLPCTPRPLEGIRLRGSDLAGGFVLDSSDPGAAVP